jgi:hypothetical protein
MPLDGRRGPLIGFTWHVGARAFCQANDAPFGCYTSVENGKAGMSICAD